MIWVEKILVVLVVFGIPSILGVLYLNYTGNLWWKVHKNDKHYSC